MKTGQGNLQDSQFWCTSNFGTRLGALKTSQAPGTTPKKANFRGRQRAFRPHPTWQSRGGPKGVSTEGVSMKRPNFHYFREFYTVVSKGNFQKSPSSWMPMPLLWRPCWSFSTVAETEKLVFVLLVLAKCNGQERPPPLRVCEGRRSIGNGAFVPDRNDGVLPKGQK